MAGIENGDLYRYFAGVGERLMNPADTVAPESAGTISLDTSPGAAAAQMLSRFGGATGQAAGGPDPLTPPSAATQAPAPQKPAPAPAPTRGAQGPAGAIPARGTPAPMPMGAQPAPAQPTAFNWYDVASTAPESDYDSDVRVARAMSHALAGIGDNVGAQEYRKIYHDAVAKRYASVAENAISTFAATGDVQPAIALYNHMIPNGKKITRVGREGDNLLFELSDGRQQMMTPSQLQQMLAQFQDPKTIATMFGKAAEGGINARNKSAELQQRFGYDAQLEAIKAQYRVQGNLTEAQFKQAQADQSVKIQSLGGDRFVAIKGGNAYLYQPAQGDADLVGNDMSVTKLNPSGGDNSASYGIPGSGLFTGQPYR